MLCMTLTEGTAVPATVGDLVEEGEGDVHYCKRLCLAGSAGQLIMSHSADWDITCLSPGDTLFPSRSNMALSTVISRSGLQPVAGGRLSGYA